MYTIVKMVQYFHVGKQLMPCLSPRTPPSRGPQLQVRGLALRLNHGLSPQNVRQRGVRMGLGMHLASAVPASLVEGFTCTYSVTPLTLVLFRSAFSSAISSSRSRSCSRHMLSSRVKVANS